MNNYYKLMVLIFVSKKNARYFRFFENNFVDCIKNVLK